MLLHGIGADEHDLFGIAPFLDERFFIASLRAPYDLPYGGYAWFELYIEPGKVVVNVKQAEESRAKLLEFIPKIVADHDLDPARVYLCGFSQGSIISLSAVLTEPAKFAGLVCMSGRCSPEMLPKEYDLEALKYFPIFVTHGVYDPVLPVDNGRGTKEVLSRLPVDLKYNEYEMGHEISQDSLTDVSIWLADKLDRG